MLCSPCWRLDVAHDVANDAQAVKDGNTNNEHCACVDNGREDGTGAWLVGSSSAADVEHRGGPFTASAA